MPFVNLRYTLSMPISAYLNGAADTVLKGMSALVPEKRADKHGKLVTRHVKLPSTLVGRTEVPAPTINRSVIAEGVIEGVIDTFNSTYGDDERQDEQKVFARLRSLPDNTLNFISTVLNKNERFVSHIDCILISLLETEASAIEIDDAFFLFDGLSHREKYDRTMRTDPDDRGGIQVGWNIRGHLRGMSNYELNDFFYIPDEIPLRQQDEIAQLKAQALFEAGQSLPEGSVDGVYSTEQRYTLRDKELAQLLVDYPLETSRVLEMVEERGIENLAVIRDVMESSTPAMSEGVL